jgi:tetratricopeptide (TPR) repeat protein
LLKGLASSNNGLCIVTTRYSIPDLKAFWQTTAPEVKLLRLTKEAGVALLKSLGVKGLKHEYEQVVEEVKGHALTLNLLGTYLHDAHAGDIRKHKEVKLEDANAEEQGGHAFHVMNAYVNWLEYGGKDEADNVKGRRALALLRLLGLFDRPMSADCCEALLQPPAIPNLTVPISGLSEAQRNMALTRLETAKLLTVNRDSSGALVSLDAHPLLREYFAQQLRTQYPDAWQEAHRRLYQHLCDTTDEGETPTLQELQPLYQAVAHGCHGGLLEQTCAGLYCDRILKGTGNNGFYSWRKLGAFGSELGALVCFFETPWTRVWPTITQMNQAWLRSEAAFTLRALGRLTEASEPLRASIAYHVKQEDWRNAAVTAHNLSELELTLGKLKESVADGQQSVTYCDQSDDEFWIICTRTMHAEALYHAGRYAEAEQRFEEAETRWATTYPHAPLMSSLSGYRYCDLQLDAAERSAWQLMLTNRVPDSVEQSISELIDACDFLQQRAAKTLAWVTGWKQSILTLALDHLTIGRTLLYKAILGVPSIEDSAASIEQAVSDLRRAGDMIYFPRGLLTRAWYRYLTKQRTGPESAQSDLDEAWEIAERGPMRVYLADVLLYRARLFFAEPAYPWDSPQADLEAARNLIETCGYGRRTEELEAAEACILA